MQLFDTYSMDDAAKVRYTDDGYMTATPRVARTGVQLYYGRELGLTGDDAKKVMKVYRPDKEVFKSDSLHSFAHRPFTDNHPPVPVNAANWKDYAKGQAGAEVLRDGEFIRVPMVLMDGATIQKFRDGKAELSVGYDCEIDFASGTAPDGTTYDASQRNIRANHFAVVDAARGGDKLRIGDGTGKKVHTATHADGLRAILDGKVDRLVGHGGGVFTGCLADTKEYPFLLADGSVSLAALRSCKADAIARGDGDILAAVDSMLSLVDVSTQAVADGKEKEVTMSKIITVDGISVEVVNDQAAQIIQKALSDAAAMTAEEKKKAALAAEAAKNSKDSLDSATAKHATEAATKDAEIATLKKQVEDGKLTPAKLDQLVKDRAVCAGKARAILGDKLVVDNKTDTEIMRQVVDAKLGEVAKAWSEDQVKISFETLTAGTKPVDVQASGLHDTARAFSTPGNTNDSEKLLNDRDQRLSNAWKGTAANA